MKHFPLVLRTVAAWLATLLIVFPLIWLVITAFKTEQQAITIPPELFFTPTLDSFVEVNLRSDYLHFAFNSVHPIPEVHLRHDLRAAVVELDRLVGPHRVDRHRLGRGQQLGDAARFGLHGGSRGGHRHDRRRIADGCGRRRGRGDEHRHGRARRWRHLRAGAAASVGRGGTGAEQRERGQGGHAPQATRALIRGEGHRMGTLGWARTATARASEIGSDSPPEKGLEALHRVTRIAASIGAGAESAGRPDGAPAGSTTPPSEPHEQQSEAGR